MYASSLELQITSNSKVSAVQLCCVLTDARSTNHVILKRDVNLFLQLMLILGVVVSASGKKGGLAGQARAAKRGFETLCFSREVQGNAENQKSSAFLQPRAESL